MGESLELISVNIWHILMAMGNLVILMLIIKRFLFKPVNNILQKRQEEVEKVYTDADQALAQAEKDRVMYEGKMKNAREEADTIIKTATGRASERGEEIIEDANKRVVELLEKTDSDIALKKKKAIDEMKGDISEMVIGLAGKVIQKEINSEIHEKLIDDAIERLGEG